MLILNYKNKFEENMKLTPLTDNWNYIKDLYDSKNYNPEEFIEKVDLFIGKLGELTLRKHIIIEGVNIDLWKERIWCLLENSGHLND